MFALDDLRQLLNAQPFLPFRLHLSDGGSVEVRHREFVTAGRRYALVGLLDPTNPDAAFDRHIVLWYMHVTRVETLSVGVPPLGSSPGGSAGSSSPSPA